MLFMQKYKWSDYCYDFKYFTDTPTNNSEIFQDSLSIFNWFSKEYVDPVFYIIIFKLTSFDLHSWPMKMKPKQISFN